MAFPRELWAVIRDVVSECLIEIADKTLSLVLAAVVVFLLNDILNKITLTNENSCRVRRL